MTHTYKVSGMTCGGCVDNVRRSLEKLPDVIKAQVALPDAAVVEMKRHIPTAELQQALGPGGHYTVSDLEAPQ